MQAIILPSIGGTMPSIAIRKATFSILLNLSSILLLTVMLSGAMLNVAMLNVLAPGGQISYVSNFKGKCILLKRTISDFISSPLKLDVYGGIPIVK